MEFRMKTAKDSGKTWESEDFEFESKQSSFVALIYIRHHKNSSRLKYTVYFEKG